MHTKENALREQGAGYCNTQPHYNKVVHSRITCYENLRNEWIISNPDHSELELLDACVRFAKACRLPMRQAALEQLIASLKTQEASYD